MEVSGRKSRSSLFMKIISSQSSLPKNAMKGNGINGSLKILCNYMEIGLLATNKPVVQEEICDSESPSTLTWKTP